MSTNPILPYSSATAMPRICFIAAILLTLWAIADVVVAAVILLISVLILTDSVAPPAFTVIVAGCYSVAALVILYFGILSASHAKAIFKKDFTRLAAASRFTFIAECFAYFSFAGPITFFIHDRGWDNTRELTGWLCGLAAYLLIPFAVTLTRVVLRKAKNV